MRPGYSLLLTIILFTHFEETKPSIAYIFIQLALSYFDQRIKTLGAGTRLLGTRELNSKSSVCSYTRILFWDITWISTETFSRLKSCIRRFAENIGTRLKLIQKYDVLRDGNGWICRPNYRCRMVLWGPWVFPILNKTQKRK